MLRIDHHIYPDVLKDAMALNYLVFGIAADGKRTQIASTPSAREAKTYRDGRNSPWPKIVVYDSEGAMSHAALDYAADLELRLNDWK